MIYAIFIAFIMVFLSELGDKTQLLVLSFSTKQKTLTILLGVALGSFLSHGVAILFGSRLGLIEDSGMETILKWVTHLSFIIFGVITLWGKKEKHSEHKSNLLEKIGTIGLNYIFVIALSIAIGELGDKTFLASIGLGIQYPRQRLGLMVGAILGMVVSDLIAIFCGKIMRKKISEENMEKMSGILFLLFGVLGILGG